MTKRGKTLAAILAGSTLLLLSQVSLQLHLPAFFQWVFLVAGLLVVSVNVWRVMRAGDRPPDRH